MSRFRGELPWVPESTRRRTTRGAGSSVRTVRAHLRAFAAEYRVAPELFAGIFFDMRVRARADCHRELPDGRTNPSITVGKEYFVVGICLDMVRILNDQGEPILFELSLFDVIDPFVDPTWLATTDDDGGRYLDPPALAKRGFYERWHDGDLTAREVFARVYARLVAEDRAHWK